MKSKELWQYPIYPLLLALSAIVNLYSRYMYTYEISSLVLPLVVVGFVVGVLWYICGWMGREKHLRGLRTVVLVIALFAYSNISSLLGGFAGIVPWLYLPVLVIIIWYLRRLKFVGVKLTILLNVISAALLVSGLLSIASFKAKELSVLAGKDSQLSNEMALEDLLVLGGRPDIYHIILDEYPISEVLQGDAGVDNSEFLDELRKMGFVVTRNNRSNYISTTFSLPSLLNFSYMSEAEMLSYKKYKTENIIRSSMNNNNVFRSLSQVGYKTITTETCVRQGMVRGADKELGKSLGNIFYREIISNTPIRPFYAKSRSQLLYEIVRNGLEILPEIAQSEKEPFYVFSHVCCPHSPIQIDENYQRCESMPRCTAENIQEFREKYRNQVIGLNKLVLKSIKEILSNSPEPPIIILQSDHGIRNKFGIEEGVAVTELQGYGNLNAMYLPGQDDSVVSDDISLVNTFRLIFNLYFGTNYPLLDNLCNNSEETTAKYETQLNELRDKLEAASMQ